MKFFTPESRVGLFVIAAIALLIYMTNRIDPASFFKADDSYSITIYFDSISGVEIKSFVRVAGVAVGRIVDISLENNKAKVAVKLKNDITIRKNAVATIRSQGLLGEKFIEISGGSPAYPAVKDGDVLANSKRPMDIDEAVGKLGEALSDIQAISKSLRNIFGTEEGQKGIQQIFDNIKSISGNADEIIKDNRVRLNKILTNMLELSNTLKQNSRSFANTVKNFESISSEINRKTPSIIDHLDKITKSLDDILDENNKEKIKKTIASMKLASEKFDEALDSVRAISNKIRKGEGTFGKLVSDGRVYDKLNSTLEGIDKFVKKADKLKLFVGFRGEYQAEEGENKGYFTLKLQPREDRYYLLEISQDVRKNRLYNENNTLRNLLYSFEFSKRYRDLGLRIGLIESSFGVGADYYLFSNRFKLSLDAFNFRGYDNTVKNAQLKFTSRFNFLKYLFIYGGADEILNRKYRSLFAGAGITFDDEDLKTILGMAGLAR